MGPVTTATATYSVRRVWRPSVTPFSISCLTARAADRRCCMCSASRLRRAVSDPVLDAVRCDARTSSDMKRLCVFFVFGLIAGLRQLSSDGGHAAARNAVAAADDQNVVDVARQRYRDDPAATGQARSDLKTVENVLLRSIGLLFGQMELVLHLTLYKIHLLYTTFVVPIVSSLRQ